MSKDQSVRVTNFRFLYPGTQSDDTVVLILKLDTFMHQQQFYKVSL